MASRFQFRLIWLFIVIVAVAIGAAVIRWQLDDIPRDVRLAQSALQELVRSDPFAFHGLEGDLAQIEISRNGESGAIATVGNIHVETKRQIFSLSRMAGEPGSGFFEEWTFEGVFIPEKSGAWKASPPEFTKVWGG